MKQNSQKCIYTRVSFRPATFSFTGKETLSVTFAKIFRNTFIMANLLWNGFERRILWEMANRHTYNKNISWSRQLFQNTDIARDSVYLRTIDRKLTLNLIIISNPFTDISLLKYVTKLKHFVFLTIFRVKFGSVLMCSSQWLRLCIFYKVKELISCKYSI